MSKSSVLKWLTVPVSAVGGAVAGWASWKCGGLDPLGASIVTSLTTGTVDVCKNIAASMLERIGKNAPPDSSELFHNGHLTRLIARGLVSCIEAVSADAYYSDTGKYSDLADRIGKYWEENFPRFTRDTLLSLDGTRISELLRKQLENPGGTTTEFFIGTGKANAMSGGTIADWCEFLRDIEKDTGLRLEDNLRTAAAERICKKLPHAIYEHAKHAAEHDPAVFAGITLRFQSAILTQISELPGKITLRINDEIRVITKAHCELIASLSDIAGIAKTVPELVETLSEFRAILPELAQRDAYQDNLFTEIAGTMGDVSSKLIQLLGIARETKANTTALLDDTAELKASVAAIKAEFIALKTNHRAALAATPDGTKAAIRFTIPRRLPRSATKLFGREDDIRELVDMLHGEQRLAVTGTGGLGKTALCAEVLKRILEDRKSRALHANGIFLHDFYEKNSIAAFISSILAQAGAEHSDENERIARVKQILSRSGVILYIEGGEKIGDPSVLSPFLDHGTIVLFTTRTPGRIAQYEAYHLEPIGEKDAAAAIHHYAGESYKRRHRKKFPTEKSDPAWRELASKLGGHPLACRITGYQCGDKPYTPTKFHERLVALGLRAITTGKDSRKNLGILFRQSADALDADARLAWAALTFAGSALTPIAFLRAFGFTDDAPLERLVALGIATSDFAPSPETGEDETAYALAHALLGEWGRTALADYGIERDEVLGKAMEWAMEYWGKFLEHPEEHCRPAQYAILAPLADAILREVEPRHDIPAYVISNFYYLPARMHLHHGQFTLDEPVFRRCQARMKIDSGEFSFVYAVAISNLAQLLHDMSRLTEAEPLMWQALDIFKTSCGELHQSVARQLNNLAQLLRDTNRMSEAEPLMRRGLKIEEDSKGKWHPHVAVQLNNLATFLQATKRVAEAEPLMRRALAIDEQSNGPSHLSVAIGLNNLAQLLQATNRLAEAEPLMKRALEIFKVSYGESHSNVAVQLGNLALLLQVTNRLAEAEPMMRRHVVIFLHFTAQTGREHPHLRDALRNYEVLCQEMKVPEEVWVPRMFGMCREAGMDDEAAKKIIASTFQ